MRLFRRFGPWRAGVIIGLFYSQCSWVQTSIEHSQKKKSCFHITNHYFLGEDAEPLNKISIYLKNYSIGNFNHSAFSHTRYRKGNTLHWSLINSHLPFKKCRLKKGVKHCQRIFFFHMDRAIIRLFQPKVLKFLETKENLLDQHGKMHFQISTCSYKRLTGGGRVNCVRLVTGIQT